MRGIAAAVGVHVDTVGKWRRRFAAAGLGGLEDLRAAGADVHSHRYRWSRSRRWPHAARRDRCASVAVVQG